MGDDDGLLWPSYREAAAPNEQNTGEERQHVAAAVGEVVRALCVAVEVAAWAGTPPAAAGGPSSLRAPRAAKPGSGPEPEPEPEPEDELSEPTPAELRAMGLASLLRVSRRRELMSEPQLQALVRREAEPKAVLVALLLPPPQVQTDVGTLTLGEMLGVMRSGMVCATHGGLTAWLASWLD
jgi:hypothetical protein